METLSLTQSPFAVMTFIVAPAMLTNASCVLALSTTNRMLRARDTMRELLAKSEAGQLRDDERGCLVRRVDRVEKQATLLLSSLHAIYVALGAFSAATLVTLLGAVLAHEQRAIWVQALTIIGLVLGGAGMVGLVVGSAKLLHATRLSLLNIHEDADLVRERFRKSA